MASKTKTVKIEGSRHDLMADVTKTTIRIYGRQLVRTVNSDEIELRVYQGLASRSRHEWETAISHMAPSHRQTLANMIRDLRQGTGGNAQTLMAIIDDFVEERMGARFRDEWYYYLGFQFVQVPEWKEVDRTFAVGESAKWGEFNLEYFGTIRSVSAKTVVIDDRFDGKKRLTLAKFADLNLTFNVNESRERNAREMMYL